MSLKLSCKRFNSFWIEVYLSEIAVIVFKFTDAHDPIIGIKSCIYNIFKMCRSISIAFCPMGSVGRVPLYVIVAMFLLE